MLVLTRKIGEKLRIGTNGEIEICVVEIRGDRIRIGVNAPRDLPVHRSEVFDAIQRQNARSGQPPAAGSSQRVEQPPASTTSAAGSTHAD